MITVITGYCIVYISNELKTSGDGKVSSYRRELEEMHDVLTY